MDTLLNHFVIKPKDAIRKAQRGGNLTLWLKKQSTFFFFVILFVIKIIGKRNSGNLILRKTYNYMKKKRVTYPSYFLYTSSVKLLDWTSSPFKNWMVLSLSDSCSRKSIHCWFLSRISISATKSRSWWTFRRSSEIRLMSSSCESTVAWSSMFSISSAMTDWPVCWWWSWSCWWRWRWPWCCCCWWLIFMIWSQLFFFLFFINSSFQKYQLLGLSFSSMDFF